MGFDSDYSYCFHYSDSKGYLIFCCHSVATETVFIGSSLGCINPLMPSWKYQLVAQT